MTPVKWQRSWLVPGMAIAICMLALMYAIARYLPYAVDWHWVLRPGCLALAVATFRRSEIRFAMAASPCLSPYVLLHAWSGALASLAGLSAEMVAAVIGLWILVIYRFLPAIW